MNDPSGKRRHEAWRRGHLVIDAPDMPPIPVASWMPALVPASDFLRTLPYVCPGPKFLPRLGRVSIVKSLIVLARPKRFELLTPRFVVYGYALIVNRNSANWGQINPRRIKGLSGFCKPFEGRRAAFQFAGADQA
jgi:hypothetical protein